MLYTAEVRFERADLPARLCDVLDWFKTRSLTPGPFRYTISGDVIRLRIEFPELRQASGFAEMFGGVVLGATSKVEAAD